MIPDDLGPEARARRAFESVRGSFIRLGNEAMKQCRRGMTSRS